MEIQDTLGETSASEPVVNAEATVESAVVEEHEQVEEVWIRLTVGHAGKSFEIQVAESDRVYDLKSMLSNITDVPLERQKVLGLTKGKFPADEIRLGELQLINGKKFTLIGTPQGSEFKGPSELEDVPDVFNDFGIDLYSNPEAAHQYLNDVRNQRKIKEVTKKLKIDLMCPLRPGKHLLVLDLDYTILDTKPLTSQSLPPQECARPHLHEFLTAVYQYYDICVWSQTSWVWLETKLVELGMVGGENPYQIAFVLDKTSMFTVFTAGKNGKQYKHSVKPLKVIWNHFPQFGPKNTVHVDDLASNFVLNPGQGIRVHAFKDAFSLSAGQDQELLKLAKYLENLSRLSDFRVLRNHAHWRKTKDTDFPDND